MISLNLSKFIDDIKATAVANFQDPREHVVDLDSSERIAIQELSTHPGFQLLRHKVIPQLLKIINMTALSVREDHRFHQGRYHGFKEAAEFFRYFDNLPEGWSNDEFNDFLEAFSESLTGYENGH